jgi:hypothetical protein
MKQRKKEIPKTLNMQTYKSIQLLKNIYQLKEEKDLNQKILQESTKRKGRRLERKDFKEVKTGADLDVPGSELDNQQRKGAKTRENNYYSIGGDNHNNLDEDNK